MQNKLIFVCLIALLATVAYSSKSKVEGFLAPPGTDVVNDFNLDFDPEKMMKMFSSNEDPFKPQTESKLKPNNRFSYENDRFAQLETEDYLPSNQNDPDYQNQLEEQANETLQQIHDQMEDDISKKDDKQTNEPRFNEAEIQKQMDLADKQEEEQEAQEEKDAQLENEQQGSPSFN